MRTLRTLLATLLCLFAALPAAGEPVEAPPGVDLTPGIPVEEIPTPPGAQLHLIAARGAAAGVARSLADGLHRERSELETLLGGLDAGPMEIRFAYGREEFAALQPRGGRVPGWAAGVAWPSLGLVVIDARAAGRNGDVRGVLRHELAHVALGRLVQGSMPRWFTEGFAQLYAGEWTLSRSTTLARATVADALIPVRDLVDGWPSSSTDVDLAYAQSVSLVSFLASSGEGTLQRLIHLLGRGDPFPQALAAAYGQPLLVLEIDWKKSLRGRYGWLPLLTDSNLVWVGAGLLLVIGAWQARVRRRRRLEAMEDGPELEVDPEEGERLPGEPLPHVPPHPGIAASRAAPSAPPAPPAEGDHRRQAGAVARPADEVAEEKLVRIRWYEPPSNGWRH